MAKPRLYLFHGNDSRTSGNELRRWLQAFATKYCTTTQYVLHADELEYELLHQQLQQALQTQSLFSEPRFILVKRLSSSHPAAKVKQALQMVGGELKALDDQVTVVFWEERLIPTNHGLHSWFADHAERKQAEIKSYRVASGRALVNTLQDGFEGQIDQAALEWLDNHARRLERSQRIEAKLRAGDEIASDWRIWVLQNLLHSATLLADDGAVTVAQLEQAAGVVVEPVSPFEVVNAVEAGEWQRARKLIRGWDQGDEGAYFGLVALFRRALQRNGNDRSQQALKLLAEIEVISKNVTLRQAWLIDLFLSRCQQYRGSYEPLMAPRRLWLSHVQRVE